jgi:hypothetical protein
MGPTVLRSTLSFDQRPPLTRNPTGLARGEHFRPD